MLGKLDPDANTVMTTAYAAQKPCPRPSHWADYDETTVASNLGTAPVLARFLTDSTASTCLWGD